MTGSTHYLRNTPFNAIDADKVRRCNFDLNEFRNPLKVSYLYVNHMDVNVILTDNLGIRYNITPQKNNGNEKSFKIYFQINYNNDDIGIYLHHLSASEEGKIISVELSPDDNSPHGTHRYAHVVFSIDEEKFIRNNNCIFLRNLNIVLTRGVTINNAALHPHSAIGVKNRLVESNDSINALDSFGYHLKIVDHSGQYGERFLCINGDIYEVPISKDPTMKDGVYLTSNPTINSNLNSPIMKYFTLEEADTHMRWYKSIEQAKALGDEYLNREKEIKEMELIARENKSKYETIKDKIRMESEQEMAELKKRQAEIEMENTRIKNEQEAKHKEEISRIERRFKEEENLRKEELMRIKEIYESRSYARKDTSEIVKLAPALITGAIGLFLLGGKLG